MAGVWVLVIAAGALVVPVGLAGVASATPSPNDLGSTLTPTGCSQGVTSGGCAVHENQYLESPNGRYELIMQSDKNLVLYTESASAGPTALWATNTTTTAYLTTYSLHLYSDGSLKISVNNASNVSAWVAGTKGTPDPVLVLQNDGNLVLYGKGSSGVYAAWATGTEQPLTRSSCNATSTSVLTPGVLNQGGCLRSPNGRYELAMQTDSNLVLYDESNPASPVALWALGKSFPTTPHLRLTANGTLAMVFPNGGWSWSATPSTTGTPNPALVMQNDGNVVLYGDATGGAGAYAVWSTGTVQSSQTTGGYPTLATCGDSSVSELTFGQILGSGACLLSSNHDYELIMQTDGNLVLYFEPKASARWAAFPLGPTAATKAGDDAVLYTNGNLCIEGWCNDVTASNARLVVQDDGNLVEYVPSSSGATSLKAVWTSTTVVPGPAGTGLTEGEELQPGQYLASPNGHVTLTMQTDGNLVAEFEQDGSTAFWSSKTAGNADAFLALQSDGNLILYKAGSVVSSGNGVLWSDGCPNCNTTYPQAGNEFTVQNDGNLVVYNSSKKAIWSSGSVVAASGTNIGSTLKVGQTLSAGQYMQSPNGDYTLYNNSNQFSGDLAGKLELMVAVPSTTQACSMEKWGTEPVVGSGDTYGNAYASGAYLKLTSTGNLTYHFYTKGPNGYVGWSPNVTGGSLLTLQNDGNLVLYGTPTSPTAPAPVVWQSETNAYRGTQLCAGETLQQGQYLQTTVAGVTFRLTMQTDGNLVLYKQSNRTAVWNTGTEDSGSDYAVQQTTGNFVIYGPYRSYWSTGSNQSSNSNDWAFMVGYDTKDGTNATKDWGLQVYNVGTGDWGWYADAKHETGTLIKPPATTQIAHGAQAILNLTVFILF